MEQAPETPAKNSDNLKDSCQYSVELAKQFLTMASAGIALVTGLVLTGKAQPGAFVVLDMVAFVMSTAIGLVYVMAVIGHIGKGNNYDVYTPFLKGLGLAQLLSFLAGIVFLGVIVSGQMHHQQQASPGLEVKTSDRTITHPIDPSHSVTITVSDKNEVKVVTSDSKKN